MKTSKKFLSVFMAILMLFTTFSMVMPVFAEYKAEIESDTNVEISEEENRTYIVSENIDKRTETTKQFLMSDGSFLFAQYNSSVHYLAEDNEWLDVDNSLNEAVATTTQSELFGQSNIIRTNNQETNFVFAEKANSNTLVLFEDEKYPISLNYQSMKNSKAKIKEKEDSFDGDDAFLNLSNLTDEIIYENVYENVDLQYIVSSNGIKENIILKNVAAQNSFVVNYNIGDLTARVVTENEIQLLDVDDVIYVISAPVMYDAEGNTSSEIELNITKNKNGKLRFEILPDEDWLSTAVYPVTIDPSIIEDKNYSISGICVNGTSTSTENFTLSSQGSYTLLDIQKIDANDFFDHVVSAKLNLPVVSGSATTSGRVYVREITGNWKSDDGITNTNPSVATTVEDYVNITSTTKTLSFDLTGLYSKWENGGSNKGIKLEMVTSGSVSFETVSDSPILTVQYMNTCGLDSSMPYTEFDMGSAGYVYVNNYSGNLVLTRDDEISTTGEEYPYNFSMTYNSLATIDDSNSRWLPSYMSGFSSSVVYTAPDGTQQFFVKGINAENEDFYDLKENDYGWECLKATEHWSVTLPIVGITLRVPVGFDACKNNCTEKYSFNTSGLQKITIGKNLCSDEPANERVILSREKIEGSSDFYIVDGSGHKLLVSETDSTYIVTQYIKNTDGTYTEGESVTYAFDENGNVTQIMRDNSVEATFTYENGNIATITDNENHTLEFDYNGKRIVKVEEERDGEKGSTVSFTRTANTVTTRTAGANGEYGDDDDSLVTSRFDSSLNPLGESYATVLGESLGAVSYERDDEAATSSVFDGISRVGVMGKNQENLLKNHSIESLSGWSVDRYLDTDCNYSYSLDSNVVHSGEYSAKITVNDVTTNGGACVFQRFDYADGEFERNKDYVLSAYVKTDGITRDPDVDDKYSYGATILVREVKSNGKVEIHCGENLIKTDSSVDNGWSRISYRFTVPKDCDTVYIGGFLRNGTGTAYFDSFQLEEGEIPSQYNLLENNSFERVDTTNTPEGWTRYRLESTDVATDGEFKITGNPTLNKGLYQEVELKNAAQSDTYVFSGWSHGEGVPVKSGRRYCLYGFVFYEDAEGNRVDENGIPLSKALAITNFDSNSTQEQFLSMSFDLAVTDETWTPYRIRVAVCYYQGVNDVYFDDVSLIRTNDVIDLTETETEEEETTDPYTYDDEGNILTYTDEEGTVFYYDSSERITTETLSDGTIYTYTYDVKGNLVSRLKTVTVDGVETQVGDRYTYVLINGEYYIKTETYEDGTTYTYDYRNDDEDPDNDSKLKTETIVSDGVTEVYNYDENENLESYVVDNEIKSSYTYTVVNGESLVASETHSDGSSTAYTYYADGSTETMTQSQGETTLKYYYGTHGEITQVDHNGFSYVYEYDNFGNTINVSVDGNPDDNNNGQSLIQYKYQTDKSKLASMTYGNGDTVSYEYDNYGGISKKRLSDKISDGSTNNYYYTYLIDGEGRPVYEKDTLSQERTTYQYDFNGNLVGERVYNYDSYTYANQLYEINNNFDEDGNIIKNALQTHVGTLTTNYAYDAESGLPTLVTLYGGRQIEYDYDSEGVLTRRILSTNNKVNELFSYDESGLISTHKIGFITESENAETGEIEEKFVGDEYTYTYDENYNITEIKKGDSVQQSYEYDALNQLIKESDSETGKIATYTYDGYGNITSKTEYAYTEDGTLGEPVDVINYAYDSVWKDKLKFYDGVEIHYDDIGNPTNYMGADMTWLGRQMMSYSIENEIDISYTYDADGLRTSKTVNGVKHNYYYVDGQLRYERNGDNYEIYYTYDADGRPVLATKRDLVAKKNYQYYLITNTRGDVIETRNGNGNVNAKFVYDAWGKLVSVTDANGNALSTDSFAYQISLKYRGYVYDNETGLYYLQSRYYDPETGRFLNADDVDFLGASGTVLGYNAFAYCENNAVNDSDPNGCVALNAVVGFIVGAVFGAIGFFLEIIIEDLSLLKNAKRFINKVKDTLSEKYALLKLIIDTLSGGLDGAVSSAHVNKIIKSVDVILKGIKEAISVKESIKNKDGTYVLEKIIETIVSYLLSKVLPIDKNFRGFNSKKMTSKATAISKNIKKLSKDKINDLAKVIKNQIIYYIKSNKTLYKRFLSRYSLTKVSAWLSFLPNVKKNKSSNTKITV